MQFAKRDLTKFELFKPKFRSNRHGDKTATYNAPAFAEFYGNMQPYSEKSSSEAYGIDLKYAYAVYTPFDVGFTELDRISDGDNFYDIKVIQRWKTSFYKLLVERVMSHE